jgi:hypothetical protein
MPVDLDDGGINHRVLHVRILRGRIKKPFENIGFDPVPIPFEYGIPLAKQRRKITPGTSSPDNPKHRLNKATVVRTATPWVARLTQAVRFHLRPLGVSQYKAIHPKLESQTNSIENPKSQQTLDELMVIAMSRAYKLRNKRSCPTEV